MSGIQPLQILSPTLAGGTSSEFEVGQCPVSVSISGAAAVLAGAETVTIHYKDASGTFRAMKDAINGLAEITAGETSISVTKRGTFKAVLTATPAALTGIEIADCNT